MRSKVVIPAEWTNHDRKVRPYVQTLRLVGSLKTLLGVVLVWRLIQSHQLMGLEAALAARGAAGFSLYCWYFGTLAVLWAVVSFPFLATHYAIERYFGVSRQSIASWLGDYAKAAIVGAALGLIVLLFIWWALAQLGGYWWVALSVFFILFSVVLAQLAPVLLLPLFFKMKPLPEGELRTRLLAISAQFGVSVKEIFLLGLGDKTEKGNAAFMGLGKTKRIALGDTIYGKYPADQVLAVFAHELGHMVHQDIWKGLFFSSCSLFLSFGVAHWICQSWIWPSWFTWGATPFGLFLYFVTVTLVGVPIGIIEKAYSRWREKLADRFAAEELKMGLPLADALEALTFQNRSYFIPSAIREFLFFSHPAPWRRIARLRS